MFRNSASSIECQTVFLGIVSLVLYVYLAFHSQGYGQATLMQMLCVCFSAAALCFLVLYQYIKNDKQISLLSLLVFAVLFRLAGFSAFPVLEDDVYRYLWDGRMTVEFGSPYLQAPSAFFDDSTLPERFETILSYINHPEIATVYGPMSQWLFALAYVVSPGEVWPIQLFLIVADMIIVLALLALTKPNNVLLYAWCPLVIKEFAFTAHPDVLGVMFMVLAMLLAIKKTGVNRFYLVGLLLALAVAVKVFAVLIVPFILRFNIRGWLAFIAVATLVAVPFGVVNAWLPEGLKAMGDNWLFNAPLYELLSNWFETNSIKVTLVLTLALGSGLYLLTVLRQAVLSESQTDHSLTESIRGDYLFMALLLAIPAFNPWYLLWVLPFAVIRPSRWAWVASFTLLLSYVTGLNTYDQSLEAYQLPSWILLIEFLLIVIAFIYDRWHQRVENRLTF